VTVTFPVETHPLAPVPVTVYVVVVVGETDTVVPLNDPGIHAYVEAPAPVRVVPLPLQMVALEAVAVTVGDAITVITCVVVPVPLRLVAVYVTVYVPAVFQTTPVTFCVVADGGVPLGKVHVQDVGLFVEASVKLTGVPAQTVVALAVNVATGGSAEVVLVILILSTYRA